ncbi:hypothetical protein ACA910_005586 [Epithemia clementina (nom. ined.)]
MTAASTTTTLPPSTLDGGVHPEEEILQDSSQSSASNRTTVVAAVSNQLSRFPPIPTRTHGSDNAMEEGDTNNLDNAASPEEEEDQVNPCSSSSPWFATRSRWDWTLPKVVLPPKQVFDPVQTFVANAMQEQEKEAEGAPPTRAYRALVDALRLPKDREMLCHILLALRTGHTLILLTKPKHARLLHNLVRLNPFTVGIPMGNPSPSENNNKKNDDKNGGTNNKDDDTDFRLADAHLNLLMAIVSAKSVLVVPIMISLWKMVTTVSVEPSLEMIRRVHAALATLMRLCPKGKTEMFPIIASNVPFRFRSEEVLVRYFQQTLLVVQYLPSIQNQVVELMMEKSLEMDVQIKITDEGQATMDDDEEDNVGTKSPLVGDDHDGGANDGIFEFDEDNSPASSSQPKADGKAAVQASSTQQQQQGVSDMANKLDSLLLLLFQFIESRPTIAEVFPTLLNVVTNSVLITHKSKFVQFVVLHACGLDEERRTTLRKRQQEQRQIQNATPKVPTTTWNSDHGDVEPQFYRGFAALLVDIVMDPYRATSIRQTAALYLASFVSRASFVNAQTVCETVAAFLRWAETYMTAAVASSSYDGSYNNNNNNDNNEASQYQSARHSLFYTICQSAFYVMCFRAKEAMEHFMEKSKQQKLRFAENMSGNDPRKEEELLCLIDVSSVRWTMLCGHALRPLKYCLESVKTEFLQVATFYQLIEEATLDRILTEAAASNNNLNNNLRKRKKPVAIRSPTAPQKERLHGGVGGLGRGKNPLDSFFPFDPFLLRQSHVFIEPYYNHWLGSISSRVQDNTITKGDDNDDMEEEEVTAMTTEQADSDVDVDDDGGDDNSDDSDDDDDDDDDDDGLDDSEYIVVRGGGGGSSLVVGSIESAMAESLSIGRASPLPSNGDLAPAAPPKTIKRSRAPSIETGSWQ